MLKGGERGTGVSSDRTRSGGHVREIKKKKKRKKKKQKNEEKKISDSSGNNWGVEIKRCGSIA